MKLRQMAIVTFSYGILTACASLEAHYVGNPSPGQHIGGVPIVVERPRWFKVTYKTVTYGQVTTNEKIMPDGKNIQEEVRVTQLPAVEEIIFDTVTVGEIYALDLKRPAAGSTDYEIEFADGRSYPKRIKGKVEDKTIQEMRETIDKLLQQIPKAVAGVPTAGELPSAEVRTVKLAESVKRIELYDIANLKSGPVLTFQP
jgi:hypothetical protein